MAVLEDLRQKTGELLDEGLRSGNLTPEEHSWRRSHLADAASAAELESLVEDLLDSPVTAESKTLITQKASLTTILSSRNFHYSDLGLRSDLVTIMGSATVDLRDHDRSENLSLEVVVIMGELTVEVPADVRVRVEVNPIMGDCAIDPEAQSVDGTVRITGIVIMGSLRVVRRKLPTR